MDFPRLADFIEFARKRHEIYLRRQEKMPKPWTDDPILRQYSFTNVFRELDKTTIWYRENVREPYDGNFKVFMATILFRWFNRIETCEALFRQADMVCEGATVAEYYLDGHVGISDLKRAILAARGMGPYTTGAYIITSPAGMNKLDGVLHCVDAIYRRQGIWRDFFEGPLRLHRSRSLHQTWESLKEEKHMGPFMAYEIVTDLRHTYLLQDAPDIMSWANPGPGAKRGLMRIMNKEITHRGEKILFNNKQCIDMMRVIMSNINEHGLVENGFWPRWEMRDVEHTLCEFDKYERVRTGLGRPRSTYNG